MLDVIAEHSVALLTVVRAMVDDRTARASPDRPTGGGPPERRPKSRRRPSRYQHIPITVEE